VSAQEVIENILGWLFVLVGIAVYALPIIIAHKRRHPQTTPIVLITLLAGWTIVGWFVALIWSVASFREGRR
jgi:hypothetical protein